MLGVMAETRQARPLCSEGFQPVTDLTGSKRVHRACRYVCDHLSGEIRLDDAARAAAFSPAAFCRFFKGATGRRLFDFVNGVRIGQACAQLIETDKTIAGIAHAAGFNNLANFNRRFRERHGMPPTAYRRHHAAD